MTDVRYYPPMFPRLLPRTPWRGGMLADTDVVTLADAARFASKHAGTDITPADFLRAAGRGQIPLRAIVHCRAKVQKFDGGIYCNAGQANENIVPAGAIPTLPLTACQHLAAAGRASWRTFDGFETIEGELQRFTKGTLIDGEPDFETVPDDCRMMGGDVHSLADMFIDPATEEPQDATPAPVVPASDAPAKRSNRKPSWPIVAMPYMKSLFTAGHYKSAAVFYKALMHRAGESDSPFKLVNRELYCTEAGTTVSDGALGNVWAEIRAH